MTDSSATWALVSGSPAALLMVSATGLNVSWDTAVAALATLAVENGISTAFVAKLVKGRKRAEDKKVCQMTLFVKERQEVMADLTIYWSDGQDFTGHTHPVQWSDPQ